MNKKRTAPLIILVLLVTAAVLYFEAFKDRGASSDGIAGSGTIEVTEIEISSKISGRVAGLPKEEGEKVEKGALLARLEYDELSARKLSVVASYNNARKNLERVRKLYESGAVPRRDYDNMVTAFKVARANYNLVNASIENAVIYSPISGTVLERDLEVGEMAFPGTPILTVADLRKAWIRIYVSERKLGLIRLGQKAHVFIDTYPDRPFPGSVVAISNRAEFTPKTIQTKEERVKLMFGIKIAVDNPDMVLKPGMPADAVILREENE